MSKTSDAFRTISEAAQELDLPQHVLRFWETRFHQIKPMKRGGGRRYYRPDDVVLLNGIKHLLYQEGYTIKAVQRLFKEHGNGFVLDVGRGGVPADLLSEKQQAQAGVQAAISQPANGSADNAQSEQANEASVSTSSQPSQLEFNVEPLPAGIKPEETGGVLGFARSVLPGAGVNAEPLSASNVSLLEKKKLQEVLFELLECKRILDQARLN